jgi:hypothetical protein
MRKQGFCLLVPGAELLQFQIPEHAKMVDFVFAAAWNGQQEYDNNWGNDYQLPVRSAAAAAVAAAAEAALSSSSAAGKARAEVVGAVDSSAGRLRGPGGLPSFPSSSGCLPAPPGCVVREVQHVEAVHHAGGTLEVLELKKRAGASSKQHWWDEKRIRVWLPPGYSFNADEAPAGGWPMLLMADGQNMFEDWLAHQV